MGTPDIYSHNFNDLVFEHRFRQYGAYALRSTYNERLTKAAFIGTGILSLIVAVPFIMQLSGDITTPPVIPDKGFIPPMDTIAWDATPENKTQEQQKQEKQDTPKPPKGDDLNIIASEKQDTASDEKNLVQETYVHGITTGNPGPDLDPVMPPDIDPPPPPPPVADPFQVEKWPKFDGDLGKWLGSHLVYPQYAKEAGIQGTVLLSFIVDEEGSVSDIKILRDIGGGCGESAVRTVKQMPKWIPGMQGGKAVKVLYTQKIKFTLTN